MGLESWISRMVGCSWSITKFTHVKEVRTQKKRPHISRAEPLRISLFFLHAAVGHARELQIFMSRNDFFVNK